MAIFHMFAYNSPPTRALYPFLFACKGMLSELRLGFFIRHDGGPAGRWRQHGPIRRPEKAERRNIHAFSGYAFWFILIFEIIVLVSLCQGDYSSHGKASHFVLIICVL